MTIEIYRKRSIPGGYVTDDYPELIYSNVENIEIGQHKIYGTIDGEQLTIDSDRINYVYMITSGR